MVPAHSFPHARTRFTIRSMKYAATLWSNQRKHFILRPLRSTTIEKGKKRCRSTVQRGNYASFRFVQGSEWGSRCLLAAYFRSSFGMFIVRRFGVKETCMKLLRYSFLWLLFLGRGESIFVLIDWLIDWLEFFDMWSLSTSIKLYSPVKQVHYSVCFIYFLQLSSPNLQREIEPNKVSRQNDPIDLFLFLIGK